MSSIFPRFDTKLFTEVWGSADDFKAEYTASPLTGAIHYGEAKPSPETGNYPDNVSILYYLLYAKYGNSPIANYDENQFKYKVFSIIYSYGPAWEKRLDIQDKLRKLSESEIMTGSKAIYNQALNPSTAPSTGSLTELEYINAQNTSNYKRGKLEGYSLLWDLLATDVTTEFINKFGICFSKVVRPENPIIYRTSEDEDDE